MIIEVTIPEKVSMNRIYAGMKHWDRTALKNLFHDEFLEIRGKLRVTEYPIRIRYDWHFKKQALDTLNCAFMSKMLEDGMVCNGILKDDSPNYVRESILNSMKSKKYKNDTVVITIEKYKND